MTDNFNCEHIELDRSAHYYSQNYQNRAPLKTKRNNKGLKNLSKKRLQKYNAKQKDFNRPLAIVKG